MAHDLILPVSKQNQKFIRSLGFLETFRPTQCLYPHNNLEFDS